MRARWTSTLAAGAVLATGVALADTGGSGLSGHGAFGIDREDGRLVLYTFNEHNEADFVPLGVLEQDGQALLGIEGSTYVPAHSSMVYAFWTDEQGQTHLLHVMPDDEDAENLIGGARPIEGGRVTGAASFEAANGEDTRTFILQRESVIPTYDIDGRININPNNAEHMRFEFQRVTDDGETVVDIDRWDLNDREWRDEHGEIDSDGNLVVFEDTLFSGESSDDSAHGYEDHQTIIQVRPKGKHDQDQIHIVSSESGDEFELHNSNTYNLSGKLAVKLFNDHVNDEGMAMGKWWLKLEGQAQFEQSEVGTVNRIAELKANDLEPEVIEAAVLDDEILAAHGIDQDNLIGLGGRLDAEEQIELFMADGNAVYRVRPAGSASGGFDADNPVVEHAFTLDAGRNLRGLDFAGDLLVGVDGHSSAQFVALDVDVEAGEDPVRFTTSKPGPDRLGTITFLPLDTAEAMLWSSYD